MSTIIKRPYAPPFTTKLCAWWDFASMNDDDEILSRLPAGTYVMETIYGMIASGCLTNGYGQVSIKMSMTGILAMSKIIDMNKFCILHSDNYYTLRLSYDYITIVLPGLTIHDDIIPTQQDNTIVIMLEHRHWKHAYYYAIYSDTGILIQEAEYQYHGILDTSVKMWYVGNDQDDYDHLGVNRIDELASFGRKLTHRDVMYMIRNRG